MHKKMFATFAFAVAAVVISTANFSTAQAKIVAGGRFVDFTVPIGKRTLYTPTTTGLYRLTLYGVTTVNNPTSKSSWSCTIEWSDDSGATNTDNPIYAIDTRAGSWANFTGYWGQPMPIEVSAGTPITFAITRFGPADKTHYSVYWTLEQLQQN